MKVHQSLVKPLLVAGTATVTVVAGLAGPVQAGENYGQYSQFAKRSAGNHWSGGQAAGQWTWKPLGPGTSEISWGDPKKWPPSYAEKFVHVGNWLMLDGWRDNGTYYTVRVTKEQIGDAKCKNLRTFATSGRQHYVKWDIPSTGYCLKAWGTITEKSSGKVVDFGHTQIWSPPAPCSNKYLGTKTCIKQWESWWDNNGKPGKPITRKLDRDQYIARGLGMAFKIQQYYPKNWKSEARNYWKW
ncbi:hypothetical protein E1295_22270 [Nonomuraea mesophila]|uniref:Secreted protein n=1 Tax=Nonomuraea mesophila TaxID=2530382 RepID=A0A4R5FE98_9ACTN|nr:hypothetical protein [Nonomuraea mesophila]TDE47868.1 hypothetical protein E1295_22270 [Nonomuraea mesophila]